jgi:dihydrofolate synthase/folylpolyglutamate synthase
LTVSTKLAPSAYDVAVGDLLRLGHELHQTPSHKFDLANMRVLLGALGHPERRFPSVLIAGTNGKGSTAAMLESILRTAGFRTGLYTSPHLIRVNERICVMGGEISDVEFAEMHARVESAVDQLLARRELPWHPSFFEMLTAMAFEHFASSDVEVAVLEVGMGGRLDATNVVDPCISVITDISLDHQNFLGNTITEIAQEKAGIIRDKGIVVALPQHPEANDVIGKAILERKARAVSAVPYMPPQTPLVETRNRKLGSCYQLEVLGEQIEIHSHLLGSHQLRNSALAITAAIELKSFGFGITAQHVQQGIAGTRWPGRFQIIPRSERWPETILDVAHNPAGAWALRAALSRYYEDRPMVFVFGAMRDKAVREMADILFPTAELVIATQADTPRAATPEQIKEAGARTGAEIICAPSTLKALERGTTEILARAPSLQSAVLVVTGSIYIVGEALRELQAGS